MSIDIRVLNRGFLKNELIGMATFALSTVYFKEKHKVEHRWIALENPDAEDFENMKGLLKISGSVLGPNDNAMRLESHYGPEPAIMKMLMSSNIKRTFTQLKISVIEVTDLPSYGIYEDSIEPYFKVHYGGGNPIRTDNFTKVGQKIAINQTFMLPVQTPVIADRLIIEVFHKNSVLSDTKIGAIIVSAKQLLASG